MSEVVIAGAGASGMMCAVCAARRGHRVHLLEKNEKAGKKLYITGKGRCNLTNACDMEALMENVVTNRKFLFHAFYGFTNYDVISFFEELGLETKVERGGRVFPKSDKASDVIRVLLKELEKLKVDIQYNTIVKNIYAPEGGLKGVNAVIKGKDSFQPADAVVIATGGMSYPSTGSTGDGYRMGESLGHKMIKTSPSLVPMNVKEGFVKELQGLSLKNIRVRFRSGGKELYEDFGEMLFTHFGVSGPVILSASSFLSPYLEKGEKPVFLSIDLKPALSREALDERILRDFSEMKNRQFSNSLKNLLPARLIPVMIELSKIPPAKRVNEITRGERDRLVSGMKELQLQITGLRGFHEAVITKGGLDVKQIHPATMESKLVKNVYFIGEALDLDALTGGFNLQIAWSTAFMAGKAIK